MEKIDPHRNKEKYLKWKRERASSEMALLSEYNGKIWMRYINDMETGLNVSIFHKKGSRTYIRLNTIRIRMHYLMRELEKKFNLSKITDITEEQIHQFFLDMRNGEIRRRDGKKFRSVGDYVQDFKAFWHWWMKLNKKQWIEIQDIAKDLDTSGEKPDWVYMTEEQIRKLADSAKYEYKVLIWFLFDTGMRAPTEVSNIRVSDFYNDFKELNIRPEVSKTFGRRIKLMICSDLIKEYIKNNNLQKDDYLFDLCPTVTNRYLKRLGKTLFGEKVSLAGEKYSNLTLYDFRHCASCYWLPRYKSESALKYRFGWKTSDKIHYYSELLGMRDTITEEDVLLDVTKAEIEKELERTKKDNLMLCEKVESLEKDVGVIREKLDILSVVAVKKETALIQ